MATGPKDEQILDLPDGRKLAFTVTGDSSAATGNTLLLAFHGALGVGDFSSFEHVFRDSNYFCVAPTLPGWSNSSPTESDVWVTAYWKDILALVHHLEAKLSRKFETLDCMGVSYGSLAALHTAANLQRNGGPKVGKCLSMSGFVPFRTPGLDYSEGMTFQTKLTMGTFARWNPWFARFTASMVGRYTATIESTTKFAQDNIAGQLNADEKAQMERIRKQDPQDARLDPNVMGRNMYFSLRVSKKGYSTIPQNLWDTDLWSVGKLDAFPTPLFITGATNDAFAPINLQRFLAKTAPKNSTKFVEHPGGHMSYSLLFEELFPAFANWDGRA